MHLINERGRTLQAWQLYPLLGIKPGCHLPVEGFSCREVDGLQVYCTPQRPHVGKISTHRIFAICPCGQHVPFGRLGQHRRGKAHKSWAATNPNA